jgi:hypothetical protein
MTQPPTILRQNGDSIFSGASAPSASQGVKRSWAATKNWNASLPCSLPIITLSFRPHRLLLGEMVGAFCNKVGMRCCHACPIQVGHKIKAVAI